MNSAPLPHDERDRQHCPLRIGAVSYLNSKPLIEGLSEALERPLTLDYPSRLATALGAGRLDVALIPSIECLRDPIFEIISNACVATRGPVWSVKLFSRVPPHQIRRLALDEGSRTSATLVQILLAARHGVLPTKEPLPLGMSVVDSTADAILMIGDRAMHTPPGHFDTVWDLGAEWTTMTGLPFVFAVWATRPGEQVGDLEHHLEAARDRGVASIPAIASRESSALSLTTEAAEHYLRTNLHFRLGPDERAGYELFHTYAERWGLVPQGVPCVFRHHIHT